MELCSTTALLINAEGMTAVYFSNGRLHGAGTKMAPHIGALRIRIGFFLGGGKIIL